MRFWLIVLLLTLFCSTPAYSQQWSELALPTAIPGTERTNDLAIIVAIEDYQSFPAVTGALRNARDWESFFKNSLGVGSIDVLYNELAVREEIEDLVEKQVRSSKQRIDTVWFVFIGHGMYQVPDELSPAANENSGLLVGFDARATTSSTSARSIHQDTLFESLNSGPQKRTVMILDACFSGSYESKEQVLVEGIQPAVPESWLDPGQKMVVFSAGKSNQVAGSLPGEKRPAFTYLFLEGLIGPGDRNGNDDAHTTAKEAIEHSQRRLSSVANILNRTQEPQLSPAFNEDWVLFENRDTPMCVGGRVWTGGETGSCCWRGQDSVDGSCSGEPTWCPKGMFPTEDGCFESADVFREVEASTARTTWGWVGVGTGSALLAGATTVLLISEAKLTKAQDPTQVTQREARILIDDADLLRPIAFGGFALGGALLTAGVVALLWPSDETAVSAWLGDDTLFISWNGRF